MIAKLYSLGCKKDPRDPRNIPMGLVQSSPKSPGKKIAFGDNLLAIFSGEYAFLHHKKERGTPEQICLIQPHNYIIPKHFPLFS